MRISRLSQEIKGFQIISIVNGEVIGKVEEVMIDLKNLRVAALVTSKGKLIISKVEAIDRSDVQVWGEDVLLVSNIDVIHQKDDFAGFEEWEASSNKMKGKPVIDTNGEQIGKLNDVLIDADAKIIGYDLSNVTLEGPISDTKRIHVNATEALGADALIVDTDKLYQWEI